MFMPDEVSGLGDAVIDVWVACLYKCNTRRIRFVLCTVRAQRGVVALAQDRAYFDAKKTYDSAVATVKSYVDNDRDAGSFWDQLEAAMAAFKATDEFADISAGKRLLDNRHGGR